jgi:hypothetical protein
MSAANYKIPPDLLPYLLHEKIDLSTQQPLILKVNIIFMVVIIVACSLRFTVRFRMLRSAGLDDSKSFVSPRLNTTLQQLLTLDSFDGPSPYFCTPLFNSNPHRKKFWPRKTHLESQPEPPRCRPGYWSDHQISLRFLPRIFNLHNLYQTLHHRHLCQDLPERSVEIQYFRDRSRGHHELDYLRFLHHLYMCSRRSSMGLHHQKREVHSHH